MTPFLVHSKLKEKSMHEMPTPADRDTIANQGRFGWYDLMTTDPEVARSFYGELFGWSAQVQDLGEAGSYTLWSGSQGPIGGMVQLEADVTLSSHWMSYIEVADLEHAMRESVAHGGTICQSPVRIEGIGHFAIVTDPDGTAVSLLQRNNNAAPRTVFSGAEGHVCWAELITDNVEAMRTFYSRVVGWTFHTQDMGDAGTYHVAQRGEAADGGFHQTPPPAQASACWIPYISVADVDASSARAQELGANLIAAPFDVPQIGRCALLADPTGAIVALHRSTS